MVKPSDFFDAFERAAVADPGAATLPDAVFRFELSGDDGGSWTLDLRKGTASGFVTPEGGPEQDATIHVTADDWVALTTGQMNPMRAFMGGKIRVDGDLKLAVNLPNVVNMVEGYGHAKHSCPAHRFSTSAIRHATREIFERFELTPLFNDPRSLRRQIGGVARADRPCEVAYEARARATNRLVTTR